MILQCGGVGIGAPALRRKQGGDSGAGPLPSLLRHLDSSGDSPGGGGGVREILDPLAGRLTPKELTVLLKEQRDWRRALQIFQWMRSQGELYLPNPIHYNVVLRALGSAQEWDELRRCWIDMARDGVLATNTTYGILIDVFGKAGLAREAVLWLRHMRSRGLFPDEVTMNTAVRVLKDSGEFDLGRRSSPTGAPGRWTWRPSRPPPRRGAPRRRRLAQPPAVLALRDAPLRREEGGAAVSSGGGGGAPGSPEAPARRHLQHPDRPLLPEAEALLEKMEERGIRPDAKTFNIFMSLHAAAGDLPAVLAYYRRLDPPGELCGRKMVREVEGVIEELRAGGEPLDEQLLPVVTRMYVEQGLLAQAAAFLAEHCAGRTISSKNYAAVADVFAERGLWAEAESVFSSAEGRRRREAAEYNVMIKAYGRAKLYDRACALFERMPGRGVWPDELLGRMMREARMSPRRETFSAVMASCARAGMSEPAEEIFEEMRRCGMEASGLPANRIVLTSLIKAHRRSGDWREAQRVYARIGGLEGGADAVAGNYMIGVYADLGMVTEARAVLADLSSGGRADAASYAAMVRLYRNMGMLDEAAGAAEQMRRAGLLSDGASFGTAVAAFAGAGGSGTAPSYSTRCRTSGSPRPGYLPGHVRPAQEGRRAAGGRLPARVGLRRREAPSPAGANDAGALRGGPARARSAVLRGSPLGRRRRRFARGTFACNAAIAAFGAGGRRGRP
ncbi:unnamed protein product [Spirodela intermedia]|uniref:Uncharacterized protein n=1 Tax=Spirodela intermedia TaxID=51605 RepID=A0A7I8IFR1_SPIIN|nr:unnamed protein product [Spirodela intermedia]CAA6656668.1 unnamed protein product [Spirodela intermedia]